MRLRIWTGSETLASVNGSQVRDFAHFERWLQQQPDGVLEVHAGRWWQVSREARPFVLAGGNLSCTYGPYQSKIGANPADYPGFFAYEAWKRAESICSMYSGVQQVGAGL